uniref:Mitochondrial carrier protein n=1 Tax=Rhabditophanes sp. KR3021 TaxID=114890 RepID=A0AC35UGP0_9BILA
MTTNSTLIDFLAGTVGGIAGVITGHPLDTVKVHLQAESHGSKFGMIECIRNILKKDGALGLYKGMSSPLVSLAFINAICFGTQSKVVSYFKDKDSLFVSFIAGSVAGGAQSFLASPSELIKLRLQLSDTINSPLEVTRQIIKNQGVRQLYRGLGMTLLRDCPAFGVYFSSYNILIKLLSGGKSADECNYFHFLMAGGFAGMISWCATYPCDIIKTRYQACDTKTYTKVIKELYAENGLRSFSTGLNSTLVRAFPTNAATFAGVNFCISCFETSQLTPEEEKEAIRVKEARRLKNQEYQYRRFMQPFNDNKYVDLILLAEAGETLQIPLAHWHHYYRV